MRHLAAPLILGAAAGRIVYLGWYSALNLVPDEAHYWDWSRQLDWSYYSKGPLIALLIRGSCELFGSWSLAMTGSEMLAVRLPAWHAGIAPDGALRFDSASLAPRNMGARRRCHFFDIADGGRRQLVDDH